ncbi:histidine kinase [Flavihumibacter sp. R14]|nr:histidine kinase [Flavihumibacter soli]
MAWILFISYEISLAAAISKKFGHILDYVLHYALYIATFYYHSYYVLNVTKVRKERRWLNLLLKLTSEIILFFICGALIGIYLDIELIEQKWNFQNNFIIGNIYRCIYILCGSTAYWCVLHLKRKEMRINRMRSALLISSMEKEKLKLALVKSTINPHMLFNTLNFLYNEVRKVDRPVAEHIMSLSELMRYSLSDNSNEEKVKLNDEINYIEHYINLHKKRIPSYISLSKEGIMDDLPLRVIPLILVTMTENILQHGNLENPDRPAYINISYRSGCLRIHTENMVRQGASSGHRMGVANLKKRLKYAYPDSFNYIIENDGMTYKSFLNIHLN